MLNTEDTWNRARLTHSKKWQPGCGYNANFHETTVRSRDFICPCLGRCRPGGVPRHVSASAAPAQAASDDNDSTTTIVKTVNEVNLVFTVTDRHGHFIQDLKRDDVKVLDDSKPAVISSFSSQTDLPLRVGLLIDASSSIRDRFRFDGGKAHAMWTATNEATCDWLLFTDARCIVQAGFCASCARLRRG